MATGINCLHHVAYRCRDAEETRHFYEDLLELPLTHVIKADIVPSTGEYSPYVHIFFQLDSGEYIAFFDIGGDKTTAADPETPAWVNHIAFEVADNKELDRLKKKLEARGIDIIGVTDHHFVHSIYFFDPNGVRLELTAAQPDKADYMKQARQNAHQHLADWTTNKALGLKPLDRR
jgi:catechol 2,3-dioxygenase-like lactoylglutathione lyase family enzyme